jgi:hypothetical protein
MEYAQFLQSKRLTSKPTGFEVAEAINPQLRGDQRDIVRWACRRGRAAIFADTGLGKTFDQIEWARLVAAHTGGRVLLLSPLAVAHQTIREATKLDVAITYAQDQAQVDTADTALIITNYDRLSSFDPSAFAGVVLDESSILKAFSGATKKRLLKMFAAAPYRLCCTATPAPNDHLELGNHAEFLGVMSGSEMLARWFINDSMKAENYRLKQHARADFWRWVTSWAVCVGKPGDLGYSDEGFVLPPLDLREHIVAVDHTRALAQGKLFVDGTQSATSLWREKAATAADRCCAAAEIVQAEPGEVWVVWCDTNDEADRLLQLLPDAVEVRGSDRPEEKERKLVAFSEGQARIIITKPDIAGFGLNWQHCARMAFVGIELKRAYWQHAQRYLSDAALQAAQPTLFDLLESEAA